MSQPIVEPMKHSWRHVRNLSRRLKKLESQLYLADKRAEAYRKELLAADSIAINQQRQFSQLRQKYYDLLPVADPEAVALPPAISEETKLAWELLRDVSEASSVLGPDFGPACRWPE